MYDHNPSTNTRKRKTILTPVLSLAAVLVIALFSTGLFFQPGTGSSKEKDFTVEPQAGTWKTWVLESGSQFRVGEPPDKKATKAEMEVLKDLAGQRDAAALDKIAYWTAGAPSYRWNRITVDLMVDANTNTLVANRYLSILNTALADAMVAAWDSKYTYLRERPTDFDSDFEAAVTTPQSPSYPSEHAVAAGASSTILSYLFPDQAAMFDAKAKEAQHAVQVAGIQYPSDVTAGYELGKKVAEAAIARAKTDGSDQVWDGTMPTGPGKWTGANPALPTLGKWTTWVLESGSQYRPPEPYAYDSQELAAEMDALRKIAQERTPKQTTHGFFWEFGAGGVRNFWFWNDHAGRKIIETSLSSNPPRAARALALMNVALYDSAVACWDAKYTYWAIRPSQLDPEFKTLFPVPGHPSYPSAHSCLSVAAADVLGYLYPGDAAEFQAYAAEAGVARTWAGLHFESDIVAGTQVGHDVAGAVIEYAKQDGAQ